jgi:hypothetical protein
MKTCPSCQTANDRDARFCINCRYLFMEQKPVCPNGHTMDAFWPECYICKHEAAAASASSSSGPSSNAFADRIPPSPPPASGGDSRAAAARRETVIDPMGAAGSRVPPPVSPVAPVSDPAPAASSPSSASASGVRPRRMTSYAPAADPAAAASRVPAATPSAAEPGAGRRIVGVLVTFSWKPEGQIFPVREGRNVIGREPEVCDIAIPQDTTMSERHANIMFRSSFTVSDNFSMSGTDVDKRPIEEPYYPLRNYAEIRTGSTYWTFIQISEAGASPKP